MNDPKVNLAAVNFNSSSSIATINRNDDTGRHPKLAVGQKTYASLIIDHLPDAVLIANIDGKVLDANEAARTLLHISEKRLRDYSIDWLLAAPVVQDAMGEGRTIKRLRIGADTGKEPVDLEVHSEMITANHEIFHLLVLRNISDYQRTCNELTKLALTDDLTAICNRRHFLQILTKELDRVKRYNTRLSLILFDIDRFKNINDTFGHNAGDEVLKNLAFVSKQIFRDIDTIARLGGDEFIALMPQTGVNQAHFAAARLREALKSQLVRVGDNSLSYTISAGVIESRRDNLSIDYLLKRADTALYAAKRGGRDTIHSGDAACA